VVLFNRRNNEIQLSTNAHRHENGEDVHSPTTGSLCPTCHRPLHEEEEGTPQAPPFMDSEYFRLLSSSAGSYSTEESEELPSAHDQPRAGSLPTSAFNQGYFER